jgi:hypothetical protein
LLARLSLDPVYVQLFGQLVRWWRLVGGVRPKHCDDMSEFISKGGRFDLPVNSFVKSVAITLDFKSVVLPKIRILCMF